GTHGAAGALSSSRSAQAGALFTAPAAQALTTTGRGRNGRTALRSGQGPPRERSAARRPRHRRGAPVIPLQPRWQATLERAVPSARLARFDGGGRDRDYAGASLAACVDLRARIPDRVADPSRHGAPVRRA